MLKSIKDKSFGYRIFCYINGGHHFKLLKNVFLMNPDIAFYIYSTKDIFDSYRLSPVYGMKNVFLISDFSLIEQRLDIFHAFLTTDAQKVKPHWPSVEIINKFKTYGVRTIEIQHGLFQLGLHYYDQPQCTNFHSDSLPSISAADRIATYFPPSLLGGADNRTVTIGYPPQHEPILGVTRGAYVLILSNLHWGTYTLAEANNFYSSIFRLANQYRNKKFIWKLHHGELLSSQTKQMLENLREVFCEVSSNLKFVHENPVLKLIDLDDLIKKSDFCIASPTTCLLDIERFNKPCLIYRCNSNFDILPTTYQNNCFESYVDLLNLVSKEEKVQELKSGLLRTYDNACFRKLLIG